MKILKIIPLFILFLVTNSILAQQSLGSYVDISHPKENIVLLTSEQAILQIEFCTPSIVRFRVSWDGNFEVNEPWMVSNYNWPKTDFDSHETKDELVFKTQDLKISITKNTMSISIYDHNGKLLLGESEKGSYKQGDEVGVIKNMENSEHFFGFGERMDVLDRRAKKVRLNVGRGQGRPHIIGAYNVLEANYSPVPFFMSTQGYGIYFHSAYPTNWDMGYSSNDNYTFSAEGGELDYYFIYGPEFSSMLDRYTDITGKSPLLPKFALGLQVGTYSGGTWGHEKETSTQYVVNLARKFREQQIPLDVLHLDSTWRIFGENGGKGATSFEWRETFDNPEVMFDSLYGMHLNMVGLHLRPRFDNGKKLRLLDKARKKGFVYPEANNKGEFVNFFDQKSVDWWWENGVMRVAEQGAMFLKTDEGSAFGHKANESDKVGPQGDEIKALHNLFPIAYAKAPYEKFEEYNKIRGMNMTREGYAGIQRYPYIFAGDWPSEWQYFEPVIKAGLNIGLSGVGNWTHCMGGFEHVADPELYIRWCQFGLLSPIAHLFGMEHPNYKEPWNYGEEAQRIFKQYDELRYSLIPYLYSTAYQNHTSGKPLMRALVLDYQDDENVYTITDQYMLGENLMVCPVTTKGAQTRVVYLPEGEWINYWTGEIISGKQYKNVLCPIDQMPMFIKSGAIIPTQEVQQYIGEKKINRLILDIYPKEGTSFDLYNDDGKTLNYRQGDYSLTHIISEDSEKSIILEIPSPKGKYKGSEMTYEVRVHLPKKPSSVRINDKSYFLDNNDAEGHLVFFEAGSLTIKPEETNRQDIRITIEK